LKLDEAMKRLVRQQALGFVATVCPDGTPNLSPKGTVTVWDDEHLVFLDLRSPGTVQNLDSNPSMEINVVDPILRKGYRFKGDARVVGEGELDKILEFYKRERGVARERVRGAVLMQVRDAAPLISPVYDLGASEAEVATHWREHHLALQREAEVVWTIRSHARQG
jgi:predicted pyridoxine 5'-phosphate oxidase superfamily flavin-nucleotide-binding protein